MRRAVTRRISSAIARPQRVAQRAELVEVEAHHRGLAGFALGAGGDPARDARADRSRSAAGSADRAAGGGGSPARPRDWRRPRPRSAPAPGRTTRRDDRGEREKIEREAGDQGEAKPRCAAAPTPLPRPARTVRPAAPAARRRGRAGRAPRRASAPARFASRGVPCRVCDRRVGEGASACGPGVERDQPLDVPAEGGAFGPAVRALGQPGDLIEALGDLAHGRRPFRRATSASASACAARRANRSPASVVTQGKPQPDGQNQPDGARKHAVRGVGRLGAGIERHGRDVNDDVGNMR